MFKTKWQKKYEKAMGSVEFWRKFYREQYDKLGTRIRNKPMSISVLQLFWAIRYET